MTEIYESMSKANLIEVLYARDEQIKRLKEDNAKLFMANKKQMSEMADYRRRLEQKFDDGPRYPRI